MSKNTTTTTIPKTISSSNNHNPKNNQVNNSTLYGSNDYHNKQYSSSSSTSLPTTAYYARIILILSFLWLVVWGWQLRYELLSLHEETNRTMKTSTPIPNDHNWLFYNDNYDADESSNYLQWIPQLFFPNNDVTSQREEQLEEQGQQQEPTDNESQQRRLQNSVRGKSAKTKRITINENRKRWIPQLFFIKK